MKSISSIYPDIMECMANSDNVIRAGLTPKLRDVPNLVAGLTYNFGSPSQHIVQPVPFSPRPAEDPASDSPNVPAARTMLYDPPVPEFSVLRVTVQPGELENHRAINGPSIAIVIEGQGIVRWADGGELNVSVGHVFFVGASAEITFEAQLVTREPLTVYRAFVEVA
jgi:mannose-6-phosphate isomerase